MGATTQAIVLFGASAMPLGTLSCRGRGWPCDRLLDDRQIDDGRDHPEQHTQPPYNVVGTGPFEQHTAEIDSEEPADLMAEERNAKQHREPASSEHQCNQTR